MVEGGGMWGGGFWGRSLDFYSLYMEVGCGVGEARIECMMAYFEREFMESCGEKGDEKKEDEKKEDEKKEDEKKEDEKKEDEEKDKGEEGLSSSPFDPNRLISFERFIHPPSTFPKWGEMKEIIKTDKVVIHTEGMEVCEADAFVDFANQDIHIHRIIPSATQVPPPPPPPFFFSLGPSFVLLSPIFLYLHPIRPSLKSLLFSLGGSVIFLLPRSLHFYPSFR